QQMIQHGASKISGLRRRRFGWAAVFVAGNVLRFLGIARHRVGFNRWKKGREVVGQEAVEDKRLFNPVRLKLCPGLTFLESVSVTAGEVEIETLPLPIEASI